MQEAERQPAKKAEEEEEEEDIDVDAEGIEEKVRGSYGAWGWSCGARARWYSACGSSSRF